MANKSYLDTILEYLSPGEAQAKIRGTPEAMELVSDLWGEAEKKRNDYLYDMYSRIYRAADERPQEVHIKPDQDVLKQGALGKYVPPWKLSPKHNIYYAPNPPEEFKDSIANTIPHELIHFLDTTGGRPQSAPFQHDLIYQLIGGGLTGPRATGAITGASPIPFTPLQNSILENWLQKNPRPTER